MSIDIGDAAIRFLGDTTRLDRTVEGIGQKAKRAGQKGAAGLKPMSASLSNIKKLALGVGGVFVAWQVFRVLRDATKAALAFGKEMANVATLLNTQTPKGIKQLQILKQQILALRPELGSARDLTKGLYQALSAGVAPAQAVRLVGEAALFAKAALTDTLTAVDVMTTVMNAYGLSAEDAASVSSTLFKTIELGKITGEELASSLSRVIATAAQLNIDLPELNAGIATMTKTGVPAAEAMTSMAAILRTFTSVEATKRFDELGISQAKIRDIIAKDGLNAALQELDKRLKGNTAAMAALFRESEAQKGIFILLGKGADEYKRALGVLKKAQEEATATTIAAEKQFATLDARLEAISVTIQTEVIVALDKLTPSANAALDSLEDFGVGGKALNVVLGFLADLLSISVGVWLSFKLLLEEATFWIFRALAGISGLVEEIPLLNKFLGANAALTARFTALQNLANDSWARTVEQIGKVRKALIGARAEMGKIAETAKRAKKEVDDLGGAAGRAGPSFDLAAAGVARFRGENAALIEQFEQAAFKQHLEELNQGLADLTLNLELATEGIGAFVEPTEEQLAALGEAVKENTTNFVGLGQQAVAAFNQMAGAASGAGGVMLRIMAMIASQILNEIALRQTEVAATAAAEVGKAGVTLKALKQLALVQAVIQAGKGFAALAEFNFWAAAKHFAAAALFGSVGAMQVMAIVGAIGGRRAGAGAPGAGAEGAAPVRGQVAGATTGGGEPLEVERRMAFGGLITRPTLAMLGEHAPAIKELVVPLPPGVGGVGEPQTIEQHFHTHINIEGAISPDVLDEVIEQINVRVRESNVGLQASDSFRFTPKS